MFISGILLGVIGGFILGYKVGRDIEFEDAERRFTRECVRCHQKRSEGQES